MELHDFYNSGFGWICRHCERDQSRSSATDQPHSRAFREGESESKDVVLSNTALAKWTDKTRRFLTCPRCGITEQVDIS